jgi:hypothetical protein
MNTNFKKTATSQEEAPPSVVPTSYRSRSQSSTSFSSMVSTNTSSTLIETVIEPKYDTYGFFGFSSPSSSSPKPQQQQQQPQPQAASSQFFYENFPTQNFSHQFSFLIPQIVRQQQQHFQAFNQYNHFQSHFVQPTFYSDRFTSTPTNSCHSPATHISTSPIELSSYFTEDMNAPAIEPNSFKFDEMISKLNDLTSECSSSSNYNKSSDSNRHTPDAYSSSSISDWSDTTPKASRLWPIQQSNDNTNENEANRSYLSSPRPIRAIKKSQNISMPSTASLVPAGDAKSDDTKCSSKFKLFSFIEII